MCESWMNIQSFRLAHSNILNIQYSIHDDPQHMLNLAGGLIESIWYERIEHTSIDESETLTMELHHNIFDLIKQGYRLKKA